MWGHSTAGEYDRTLLAHKAKKGFVQNGGSFTVTIKARSSSFQPDSSRHQEDMDTHYPGEPMLVWELTQSDHRAIISIRLYAQQQPHPLTFNLALRLCGHNHHLKLAYTVPLSPDEADSMPVQVLCI